MVFTSYFDTPCNYNNQNYYDVGCSPFLLGTFLDYLNKNSSEISEIFLCFYLYNNYTLNTKLENLAKAGIRVNVITIPIEGYDTLNPKDIVDIKSGEVLKEQTKYSLAKEIFAHHYKRGVLNFTLYFFPHIYLRSAKIKNFSKGNMPYSLHLKSYLIKYKERVGDIGISSSNFAVRDKVKEENLLMIKNSSVHFNATQTFFDNLIKNSIPIYDFDFKKDYTNHAIKMFPNNQSNEIGFIAPFYFDSAFIAEDAIKALIDSAQKSIVIVAQHICPVDYTIEGKYHSKLKDKAIKRKGFLKNILLKANAGVKISFVSQTFASGNTTVDSNFRTPINKHSFIDFYNKIKEVPNILYAVNQNIHSKYIIVDDKVLVCSFNFTPSQFIYLDEVKIEKFDHNAGKSFKGIYSESGQYCIINDAEVKKVYENNFNELLKRKETKKVKG